MISEGSGNFLLQFARKILENYVKGKDIEKPKNYPKELDEKFGIFCTLNKNEQLRGCIGLPYPEKPLLEGAIKAVKGSARDPRFPNVRKEELKKIKIELSILSKMKEISPDKIKNGDGTVLRMNKKSALFLPQVWKQLKNKNEFMTQLCIKAGLKRDDWKKEDMECFKFHVKIFKE